MTVLAGLFLLRVVGEVLVTFVGIEWLPAAEHWQSGLLPYPVLLASQAVIVGLLVMVIADVWRGHGRLARSRPSLGQVIRVFACLYLASMIARYGLTMALRPEWRWFGHSIPTLFHVVLAMCLLVYSGVLMASSDSHRRGATWMQNPRGRSEPPAS